MISIFKQLPIKVRYKNTTERLEVPFGIYYRTQRDELHADNQVFQKWNVYVLEYYFSQLNEKIEEEIETILSENGCFFSKSEDIEINKDTTMIRYEIRRI